MNSNKEIVNNYKTDGFTSTQNHEYRMACEVTKQKQKEVEIKQKEVEIKQKEIEILKLRIELEKETQKYKIEMDPMMSCVSQCQEYYGFTSIQDYEYQMACKVTKQKEKDIEILKLRIELEKETQKHKIETDPTVSSVPQCQEYYGLKSVKFTKLF